MKSLYLCLFLVLLNSCNSRDETVKIGNPNSEIIWIYLCGLTESFDSPFEKNNRAILDQIGKNLNIAFIAIAPPKRCPTYQNKLCWPHHNKKEVLDTYVYVKHKISKRSISGYVGFSNGGFFLLKLAEIESVDVPLIVIGGGGYLGNAESKNKVFLLIGKQDESHYSLAKQFYQQSQGTKLDVTLIEYDGKHVIPKNLLELLIKKLKSNEKL